MSAAHWVATVAGTLLTIAVIFDVVLTVLHLDLDGPIARLVVRTLWRILLPFANLFGRNRRLILSISGPLMMTTIMLIWATLYLVGFALIYWPQLGHFRSESELGSLGFADALHFSGSTGTVLGFGDISPLEPWLQGLAIVEAGVGFAMLSGIVAWLINLSSGVTQRNMLARRMHDESAGTGDGALLIARRAGSGDGLQNYLQSLADTVQMTREKMRQFPLLDLFYRSRDPLLDPERLIKSIAEVALAARLLAAHHPELRAGAVADDLERGVSGMMISIAEQHLPHDLKQQLLAPNVIDEDRQRLAQMRQVLGIAFDASPTPQQLPLELAARTRIFLRGLDAATHWDRQRPE
jgi:hypothetical protein